jgi:hypothetical protein
VSTVDGGQAWKVTGPAIVGVTILAMGKFYAHELELGQTNILLAVVVLLALAQWKAGRPSWAGALLAAATVVKPYAIVFLPYLVARRRWRACAGFAVVLLAALLLPVLRYGFRENAALLAGWWSTVTTSTPPNLAVSDNISIAAMYAKWFGVGSPANWLALATAGLLVAVCARVLLIAPARLGPAADPHPAALAARLGLRAAARDAGGDAAGRPPRQFQPSGPLARDRLPAGRRTDRLGRGRPARLHAVHGVVGRHLLLPVRDRPAAAPAADAGSLGRAANLLP